MGIYMEKSKVFFTKSITPESVIRIYEALGIKLKGNVAVKLHSGEQGNQNFIKPDFLKAIIEHVGATVVECNTAYGGARNSTDKHRKLMQDHGWTEYFDVDIMDAEGPDMILPVENGKRIKENYVGKNLKNYDSMLVLSHFKGHPMGGYGGALKQLSIGVASSAGKCWIHSVGQTLSQEDVWEVDVNHDEFLEAMAESAGSVVNYFDGNIAYINIMCNLSVDCDCCSVAEDPCMADIGILAGTDPVALDKACIDLVYNSDDKGRDHFVERVESRNGIHTIDTAAESGIGSKEYELISID